SIYPPHTPQPPTPPPFPYTTLFRSRALARIALGLQDCLYIGNLNAKRDWGHAKDFVRAQWLMLQQPAPEDFVIATGVQRSVRDLDRKSTRLNSSHVSISYAVFCLKK